MEIAIGGIVLLVLLLPGISFNKGYFYGEFSRKYVQTDFFGLLLKTLFPSLVLYLVAFLFVYFCCGYSFDIQIFFGLISSQDDLVKSAIQKVDHFAPAILIFHLVLNMIAYSIGFLARNWILKKSWDTKYKFLRFENMWHYLLTARFLQANDALRNDSPEDVDVTFIDALVKVNEKTYIYTGTLVDYQLGKDGTLDLLIIKKAQRKEVTGEDSASYKNISGHYLVLKYADLLNLNFSFIQFDETYDEQGNVTAVVPRMIR